MLPSIRILNTEIHMYGLMAGIGLIVVIFAAQALGRRRGHEPYDFLPAMLVMAAFAIVFASLLYGLTNAEYLALVFTHADSFESPFAFLQAVAAAFAGMVFYGGALGCIVGMKVWTRATKRAPEDYFDLLAVCIPLFHAFARIGCFLGGCCYGIESDVGFVYTDDPIAEANGVRRFPVQLLESGCEAALFALLLWLCLRERQRGGLIWVWLGSYAAVRFLDEFLRGDAYRGFLGPFSTSQWISLAILVVVAIHIVRKRKARMGA